MDPRWRFLLPAPLRRLPADLALVVAGVALTVLVVATPGVRETPLRVALGLPFLLFLPGYALVALLFPERGAPPGAGIDGSGAGFDDAGARGAGGDDRDASRGDAWSDTSVDAGSGVDAAGDSGSAADRGSAAGDSGSGAREAGAHGASDRDAGPVPGVDRGIDGVERVALSFGLSIAVVPLLGLALNFTPWGIRLWPVLLTVAGFTVGCALGAVQRRRALPPRERFRVPFDRWLVDARAALFEPEDRADAALTVLLAASVLLAVGSVGYAIAVPPDGERFTEFYLLTEDEEGDLVAADYPREVAVGEPAALVVGVGNQEHERVNYTVVVQLQRVDVVDNETVVRERQELQRHEVSLAHNETWHHPHAVEPTFAGEDLRLQYLLFRGEPPAAPTAEAAYRDLHLWIDVVES